MSRSSDYEKASSSMPHYAGHVDKAAVPLVSIGMPIFNSDRTARQAIDSVLAQSVTDFELIISDNASTDLTAAICNEYAQKDRRIRYLRQNEHRRVGELPGGS